MKAIVFEKQNSMSLQEVPVPEPEKNQVLIKIAACGICGTDLHILHGVYEARFPLISVSASPFTSWSEISRNQTIRLDGPNLFRVNGRVFAVGRRQPCVTGRFQGLGSAFARKRTALFRVKENGEGLLHLSDLPGCGDTSYAGVAIAGGKVYISYYTNNPLTDYPWILGMMLPTRIQITSIEISAL